MQKAPEILYLIPGEDLDGQIGYLWCDDPAPSPDHDPAEAVEYARVDSPAYSRVDVLVRQRNWAYKLNHHFYSQMASRSFQIEKARKIISELIDFCEQPEIVAATDGAFDPDAVIQSGKRFLSGGEA